jgi:hypothetical protein
MQLTNDLAFLDCANHRSLSRLPSRRQPFPSRGMKTTLEGAPETVPGGLGSAIKI